MDNNVQYIISMYGAYLTTPTNSVAQEFLYYTKLAAAMPFTDNWITLINKICRYNCHVYNYRVYNVVSRYTSSMDSYVQHIVSIYGALFVITDK